MAVVDALSTDLWSSFVDKVQELIRGGLEGLAADAQKDEMASLSENDINRHLFFRMRRIATERHKAMLALTPRPTLHREHTWNLNPILEANNQPSPDDIERTPRENKRPDFQWSVQDDEAEDLDRAARTYVVECKRLGEAADRWVFNRNYVDHGVCRYIDAAHLYGKDDIGGAMIGYVQSMDIAAIWAEVDHQIMIARLPSLPQPVPFSGSSVLHVASHYLSRADAASPFALGHMWVDLRSGR